jgi:hypothetical protein
MEFDFHMIKKKPQAPIEVDIDSLAYSLKLVDTKIYVLAYLMHVWCTTSIFLATNSSIPFQ